MSDFGKQSEMTVNPPKAGKVQTVLHGIVLLAFIAAGWFLRGLMPGGSPMGGPPGGAMGGPSGPAEVVIETVVDGPSQPPKEYIGHVEAIQTVDIRAQVSGYLAQVHFEEGSLVKEGDLLFAIEREPYQARLALAEASYNQAKANLEGARADLDASKSNQESAEANLERAQKYLNRLQTADKRSVVQSNLDTAISDDKQARSQVEESKARVAQSQSIVKQMEALVQKTKADLDLARIDLGYTEIRSPITGQIGEAVLTKGNFVNQSSGLLARVVQVDPVRVVFSMSDRDYLVFLAEAGEGGESPIQTRIRLSNGEMYEGEGARDFEDNEMSLKTGTIAVYARFDNPARLLVPGGYVTVIVEQKNARKLPVIPQQAIVMDQKDHYVFVVDDANTVEKRRIELGEAMETKQCVKSGLSVGEKIVVEGVLKVDQGVKVTVVSAHRQGDV